LTNRIIFVMERIARSPVKKPIMPEMLYGINAQIPQADG